MGYSSLFKPCHAGLALLTRQIKLVSDPEDNISMPDNNEIEDAAPREMMGDEDKRVAVD